MLLIPHFHDNSAYYLNKNITTTHSTNLTHQDKITFNKNIDEELNRVTSDKALKNVEVVIGYLPRKNGWVNAKGLYTEDMLSLTSQSNTSSELNGLLEQPLTESSFQIFKEISTKTVDRGRDWVQLLRTVYKVGTAVYPEPLLAEKYLSGFFSGENYSKLIEKVISIFDSWSMQQRLGEIPSQLSYFYYSSPLFVLNLNTLPPTSIEDWESNFPIKLWRYYPLIGKKPPSILYSHFLMKLKELLYEEDNAHLKLNHTISYVKDGSITFSHLKLALQSLNDLLIIPTHYMRLSNVYRLLEVPNIVFGTDASFSNYAHKEIQKWFGVKLTLIEPPYSPLKQPYISS